MTSIITRRSILRGLFAAPAIVAASSLMPIRGIVQLPPRPLRISIGQFPGIDMIDIDAVIREVIRAHGYRRGSGAFFLRPPARGAGIPIPVTWTEVAERFQRLRQIASRSTCSTRPAASS